MANSDNGILVAGEVLRSIAKEYGWKEVQERGDFEGLISSPRESAAIDAALAKYDDQKNAADPKQRPQEFVLNALGYDALRSGKIEEAIRLFQRNVQEFPESGNVYDSLGEAYAAAGKKELAIEN
jgi:tetratricopeptide (TPR) repeat protein